MRQARVWAAAGLMAAMAGSAQAQVRLYAIAWTGEFYSVDTTTGAATLVGHTGFDRMNTMAADSTGVIYATRGRNTLIVGDTHKLIRINPMTGVGTLVQDLGAGAADMRGIAFGPGNRLYGIQDAPQDLLVAIDMTTGVVTTVGSTGRTDLQGLASRPNGTLFACGINSPGLAIDINAASGLATPLGGSLGSDAQTIEFAGGDRAWSARASLRLVDLVTGVTVTVGPMGVSDIRGLAAVGGGPPPCYANCDGSTTPPILNVSDFICFQTKFAANDPTANCDGSTTPPVLNVSDFICFQTLFSAGCP
jgi:hypothetical protein